MASASSRIVENIGRTIKKVAENKGSSWWYTPHMAAASRAIATRLPLVDIVVQVRDARVLPPSHFSFFLVVKLVYMTCLTKCLNEFICKNVRL